MTSPQLSVAMLAYNQERYIEQAVGSALAQQTNFPFEIVIGEDCSTDRTRDVLTALAAQHPERIRLLLPERNQGMIRNLISTVDACRGEYVALLEGDDYWTDAHKLTRQVAALDAHDDWALCFHSANYVWEDGSQPTRVFPESWKQESCGIEALFQENIAPTCSIVFRKRLIRAWPDWMLHLKLGDWPLLLLLADQGRVGFVPGVMGTYRLHQSGVWTGQKEATRMAAILDMMSCVDQHFDGKYREHVQQHRRNMIGHLVGEIERLSHRKSISHRLRRLWERPLEKLRSRWQASRAA